MSNNISKVLLINGEPTLLVHCLYQMSPLNHKRTTSSLAPPIFYVAKKLSIKRWKAPHYECQVAKDVTVCKCACCFFQQFSDNEMGSRWWCYVRPQQAKIWLWARYNFAPPLQTIFDITDKNSRGNCTCKKAHKQSPNSH